jgi:2-polyprenyl-3-methyl-5-hydroxy-6-metoxy-1,4-benzoquinol methylase
MADTAAPPPASTGPAAPTAATGASLGAPAGGVDPDELKRYLFNVVSYKMGEMVSLMIHLGDQLGLYRAMRGAGPVTVGELAEKTGYHRRWLDEWLRGQAAARILSWAGGASPDQDRFELSDVGALALAAEDESLDFVGGMFSGPQDRSVVEGLKAAFSTGIGLSYDQLGPVGAHSTERMLGPWAKLAFVPVIIPALEGLQAKLEAGATVADVGCGSGLALCTLARAFPASTFHGYDPSTHAIERARAKQADWGLGNVELIHAAGESLPAEPTYDFVYTFDCLHDMTRPDRVITAIRRAIRPDGTWLIKDIRSSGDFAKNLRNPLLAMFYGFSVASCMSSAMSEPGGMGLGTLGFHPAKAEEMVRAAGFTRFRQHDFDDPANLYYEVRP